MTVRDTTIQDAIPANASQQRKLRGYVPFGCTQDDGQTLACWLRNLNFFFFCAVISAICDNEDQCNLGN